MLTSDKIHYIIAKQVTERTTNKPLETSTIWNLSSAGRASALQAEGHRFEPYRFHILKENGEIAQLARAHGSYPWCRGFESPSRYFFMPLTEYGEIAQLARAHGSYPWCRGFESPSRYYMKSFDLFQRIFLYTKIKHDFQQYNISKFFEGTNTKNLHLGI